MTQLGTHRWDRSRRFWTFVRPCLVLAAITGVIAGLAEAVQYSESPLRVAATVGFSSAWSVPITFVACVIVRLLLRGWELPTLVTTSEAPAAARVAAWMLYLFVAISAIAAISLFVTTFAGIQLHKTDTVALATTIGVTLATVILVVISRPVVKLIAALLQRLDRGAKRGRASSFSPRRIVLVIALFAVAEGVVAWYGGVAPRIGTFHFDSRAYVVSFAISLAVAAFVWTRLGARGRRVVTSVALGAWLATVAAAGWMRYRHPFTMLEIWGEAPIAGAAISASFDFAHIRSEFDVRVLRLPEQEGVAHPDVILVTIDTVRADRTPPYGGVAPMPGLTEVASRGVVFEYALSPGNTTRRSMPSIATGILARRVRGRIVGWGMRLDPRHIAIGERFRAGGYDTAGFFCCDGQFSQSLGLSRGIEHLVFNHNGRVLVGQALDWLRERDKQPNRRPLFLWIHVFEPHEWDQVYPSSHYGLPIPPRYDRLLADTDAFLKPLYDYFADATRAARTVFTVTSDHGEGIGDHSAPAHSTDLYDTQTHVPLVIVAPGVAPRRVATTVSLVDLYPTLLDLAGFEPSGLRYLDGVSRVQLMRGTEIDGPNRGSAYISMIEDTTVYSSMDAVVVGRKKLIAGPGKSVQVYDLERDPLERFNLAAAGGELLKTLEKALEQFQERARTSPFQ